MSFFRVYVHVVRVLYEMAFRPNWSLVQGTIILEVLIVHQDFKSIRCLDDSKDLFLNSKIHLKTIYQSLVRHNFFWQNPTNLLLSNK